MGLIFDPKTGFSVDEVGIVRETITDAWKVAFRADNVPELNTAAETPAGQLIDSQTAAVVQKDNELAFLANQFNPQTASGMWQDALAKIYFLERKPALPSQAIIKCTGLAGTVIPKESEIQSATDGTSWQSLEDATIGQDGTVEVRFACTQTGAINAMPNTLTSIISEVVGWDMATNEARADLGRAEETQGAFEARRFQSVAINSRSTTASVLSRILSLDNVLSALVRQNRGNTPLTIDGVTLTPHSVYCAVIGGADAEIARAIYNSVSGGCDTNGNTTIQITDDVTGAIDSIKFERPADLNCYLQVTVRRTSALPANVEDLVKDAVFNNFYGISNEYLNGAPILRAGMGEDIFASRFYVSILNAGVLDVETISIKSADDEDYTTSTHIPINRAPALDKNNIEVIINEVEDA